MKKKSPRTAARRRTSHWVRPLWLIILALLLSLITLRSNESSNPMKNPSILMVVTSAAKKPNGERTGLWLLR